MWLTTIDRPNRSNASLVPQVSEQLDTGEVCVAKDAHIAEVPQWPSKKCVVNETVNIIGPTQGILSATINVPISLEPIG